MATESTCFHHKDRVTGRRCTRCERFACPECLHRASVGSQCWECIRAAQPPTKERIRRWNATAGPIATYVLIAINLGIFAVSYFNTGESSINSNLALFGPSVADGEWYRLITSGFIHYGIFHIAANMIMLYQLGTMLENDLGRTRFLALYFASLLGGSFGALLLSPLALTGGASGAVFGLAGALLIGIRTRGGDIRQSGIGWLIGFNLVATFVVPNISIGGHLGGLAIGLVCGALMFQAGKSRAAVATNVGLTLLIAVAAAAGCILIA